MNDLPVVLITGAAQRIGAEIAREFHRQNFRVLIHYRSSKGAADDLASELNMSRADSARVIQASLTEADEVSTLASRGLSTFGRLDVLINNASSFYPTPIGTASDQQWDDLIDSNLRGAFFLSQALAPELRKHQGAIVNLIDTHAKRPLNQHPVYSIAKAGLLAMTKSLAIELAPAVRVNGVSPGAILWPSSLEDDTDPVVLKTREQILTKIPLARLGETTDIARTVYFLACNATYVTGAVIKVDGGRAIG